VLFTLLVTCTLLMMLDVFLVISSKTHVLYGKIRRHFGLNTVV
jgi:hypothetical protein